MPAAKRSKAPEKSGRAAGSKRTAAKSAKEKRPAAAPRPRWFKVCCWIGGAVLVLFILLLALALMTFSPYRRIDIPQLTDRHFKAIKRLSPRDRKPPAEVKVRLAVDEVNALLEFARNIAKLYRCRNLPPPESFDLIYRKDGSFRFVAPVEAAPSWFFGGKIYAEGVFFLEKQDDKLIFDLPELRLGRVGASLPGAGLAAKNSASEALEQALPPEFNAVFKEIYPERDGTLVVVYRPKALLPLLMDIAIKP